MIATGRKSMTISNWIVKDKRRTQIRGLGLYEYRGTLLLIRLINRRIIMKKTTLIKKIITVTRVSKKMPLKNNSKSKSNLRQRHKQLMSLRIHYSCRNETRQVKTWRIQRWRLSRRTSRILKIVWFPNLFMITKRKSQYVWQIPLLIKMFKWVLVAWMRVKSQRENSTGTWERT